jgi:hypothetical protein
MNANIELSCHWSDASISSWVVRRRRRVLHLSFRVYMKCIGLSLSRIRSGSRPCHAVWRIVLLRCSHYPVASYLRFPLCAFSLHLPTVQDWIYALLSVIKVRCQPSDDTDLCYWQPRHCPWLHLPSPNDSTRPEISLVWRQNTWAGFGKPDWSSFWMWFWFKNGFSSCRGSAGGTISSSDIRDE